MNRGYVIVAENTPTTDYMKCAEMLAYSLKQVMPTCSVAVLSNNPTSCAHFDYVIPLVAADTSDQYKMLNDLQAYVLSPYEYTIKLEADMYVPRSIEFWWDVLCDHDLVVSTTIRNFKGEISDCRVYRRFIDDNKLPDVYNAVTYFKKSLTARHFFDTVKLVYENWNRFRDMLKCNTSEKVSTDWAYAIACLITGPEKTTLPGFDQFCMVHMKQHVNGIPSEDWLKTLVHEFTTQGFRVNTVAQNYPFHYTMKNFADIIERELCQKN